MIMILLATATEFVQLWVPGRAFNIMDWVANVAGLGLGTLGIGLGRKRTVKR